MVPDSLLRRMRADRGTNNDAPRHTGVPLTQVAPCSAPNPVPTGKRLALVMALSDPTQQLSLITWLGKG